MPVFREDLLGWLDQCVKPQSHNVSYNIYNYYLQNLQGDLCELNNN